MAFPVPKHPIQGLSPLGLKATFKSHYQNITQCVLTQYYINKKNYKDYYKQLYGNKLGKLAEMNKSPKRYNLLKLTQAETDNLKKHKEEVSKIFYRFLLLLTYLVCLMLCRSKENSVVYHLIVFIV